MYSSGVYRTAPLSLTCESSSETLQVAQNAQPVADTAASKVEAAGHITAEKTVAAADAASEDIERVAHATGQAGMQATADVSKVIEDVAHDAEVRLSDSSILWIFDVDFQPQMKNETKGCKLSCHVLLHDSGASVRTRQRCMPVHKHIAFGALN